MMNPYVLAVPERVISGAGCISKLPELLKELEKKKVALFADMGALKSGAIDATIETLKVSCESFTLVNNVPPEPEDRQVREIFGQVKDCGADAIVAIGGGSVMDTSKIISVMMTKMCIRDRRHSGAYRQKCAATGHQHRDLRLRLSARHQAGRKYPRAQGVRGLSIHHSARKERQ